MIPYKRRRGQFNYGPITPKNHYDRVMDVFHIHGHLDDKSADTALVSLASEKLLNATTRLKKMTRIGQLFTTIPGMKTG